MDNRPTKLPAGSFAVVATLFFVSFLLYWPSPRMGFVLDDHYAVANNPNIKSPALYKNIFSAGLFDAAHRTTESRLNYYRPFLAASFIPDYRVWGAKAFGYRITNIILHTLNCSLIFVFLFLLFENALLAALASLIFCVLPVHEWVVRYIVGRGDLLQAFFTLLSCVATAYYVKKNDARWLVLGLAGSAAALLCREAAVINGVYVALTGWYVSRDLKRTIGIALPYLLLGAAYYLVRSLVFPITGAGTLPAVFTAGCIALTLLIREKYRRVGQADIVIFGLGWCATLAFSFFSVQNMIGRLGPVLGQHFLYFPSVGFALLCALALVNIQGRRVKEILLAAVMAACLSVGLMNGYYWQSEEKLLRHVQRLEGRKFTVAYEQLVMRYDDNVPAVVEMIARTASSSGKSVWQRRLGDIYRRQKDYSRAISALSDAARSNPSNIEAINELGVSFLETGHEVEGLAWLEHSLVIDPHGAEACRILGIVAYRKGDTRRSAELFRRSLEYDPGQAESAAYLAKIE